MKDMSWIEMMKKAQEIRLFTSLQIKRAQKGGITSAQELDLLSRIVLSDAELTCTGRAGQAGGGTGRAAPRRGEWRRCWAASAFSTARRM